MESGRIFQTLVTCVRVVLKPLQFQICRFGESPYFRKFDLSTL
jgi:hypothetical protein